MPEDYEFMFEAEDDAAAIRRAIEVICALTGTLPQIGDPDDGQEAETDDDETGRLW